MFMGTFYVSTFTFCMKRLMLSTDWRLGIRLGRRFCGLFSATKEKKLDFWGIGLIFLPSF